MGERLGGWREEPGRGDGRNTAKPPENSFSQSSAQPESYTTEGCGTDTLWPASWPQQNPEVSVSIYFFSTIQTATWNHCPQWRNELTLSPLASDRQAKQETAHKSKKAVHGSVALRNKSASLFSSVTPGHLIEMQESTEALAPWARSHRRHLPEHLGLGWK